MAQLARQAADCLDLPEGQVLVDFFEDEGGYVWHHRLLLLAGAKAGSWIVATPDLDVELADLTAHRVVPLARGGLFPARLRNMVYGFRELSDQEVEELRRRARQLSSVLGLVVPAAAATAAGGAGDGRTEWRISDTAHQGFADLVPDESIGDANVFISRGTVALVHIDQSWVTAEAVRIGSLESWRTEKATGPGRDCRLLPDHRDPGGRRYITFEQAVALYKPAPRGKEWPFEGPPACSEFMEVLRNGQTNLVEYGSKWEKKSGVSANSATALKHDMLLTILRIAQQVDLADLTNFACFEYIVRAIQQTETATRRNPKSPDYSCLDHMLTTTFDSSGAASVPTFARWSTNILSQNAQILKQHRQWSEEQELAARRAVQKQNLGNGGTGGGGGGGNKQQQNQKGAKGGAAVGSDGAA